MLRGAKVGTEGPSHLRRGVEVERGGERVVAGRGGPRQRGHDAVAVHQLREEAQRVVGHCGRRLPGGRGEEVRRRRTLLSV
jgi:hypothetical protein